MQEEWNLCVDSRNKTITTAIRKGFAAAVRDFFRDRDQDEGRFDDDGSYMREEEQLALQVLVFCVSAVGYQKIRG